MLTLYSKESCPFCRRVLAMLDRLTVEVEVKDIADNEEFAKELIEKGGKQQVPFLVDSEADVAMYESDDIVKYLQENYGTANKPRIHIAGGDSVCVACEG